jgi:ubiquinone/menaquinone biosynthesis C-methylase UbiE
MMIGPRRHISEFMDDPAVPAGTLERALDELTLINRWLGGERVSQLGVQQIVSTLPSDRPISILDVGSGGSDLIQALAPLDRRFEVTSLDLNPLAGEIARKRGLPVNVVVGSAHALPFQDRSFDIAHLSLFLHHCTDGEAVKLLSNLSRIARHGIVINDLHRHVLAFAGISILTALFSRSRLVRHDGPASVLRGFRRSDLLALVPRRVCPAVSISRHWAFRWCVTIPLEDPRIGPSGF